MSDYGERLWVKCHGQWRRIFNAFASAQLGPAIAASDRNRNGHVPCPVHRPTTDGFRLFPGWEEQGAGICGVCGAHSNGFQLLAWVLGLDVVEVYRQVGAFMDGEDGALAPAAAQPPATRTMDFDAQEQERESNRRARDHMIRVYNESVGLDAPEAKSAWVYLQSRKIGIDAALGVDSLRFHPRLPYWEGRDKLGEFPALIGVFTRGKGRVGLHRIYLTGSGQKLPVATPKKMMRTPYGLSGAGIVLATPSQMGAERIHLCEGIETGLAIRTVMREPVIATGSKDLLKAYRVPPTATQVWIWADKDRAVGPGNGVSPTAGPGELAAREKKALLWQQKIVTSVWLPELLLGDAKSVDWNDVLVQQGPLGFPSSSYRSHFNAVLKGVERARS